MAEAYRPDTPSPAGVNFHFLSWVFIYLPVSLTGTDIADLLTFFMSAYKFYGSDSRTLKFWQAKANFPTFTVLQSTKPSLLVSRFSISLDTRFWSKYDNQYLNSYHIWSRTFVSSMSTTLDLESIPAENKQINKEVNKCKQNLGISSQKPLAAS